MTLEEYWDNCTAQDKSTFRRACRSLLKQTFIVRDKDDSSRRIYNFISRNVDFFTNYFEYMGFEVIVDREDGIAMLKNRGNDDDSDQVQTNHLRLRRIDSIILCTLWTLYSDRMREGKLSSSCPVSVADLTFALEKFGFRETIDKTTLRDSLILFSRYNLVHLTGNLGEPDCMIVLYPSLQFAMDRESFRSFAGVAMQRMTAAKERHSLAELEEEDSDDE